MSTICARDACGADAAKRRSLPAWIREGLEKVEREKQKQLEKEHGRGQSETGKEEVQFGEFPHHQPPQQPLGSGASSLSADRTAKAASKRPHSRFVSNFICYCVSYVLQLRVVYCCVMTRNAQEASDDDEEEEAADGASDTDDKSPPVISTRPAPRQRSPSPEIISEEEKQARMVLMMFSFLVRFTAGV